MISVLISIVLLILYYYSIQKYDYWSIRNVKHDKPMPYFGSMFWQVFKLQTYGQLITDIYNKYSEEKVAGLYVLSTPSLVVRDLDLARQILNDDFQHFYVRGAGRNLKKEPNLRNVFHAEGDEWKLLRQRLTPVFTSAKLRAMFPLVASCANKLQKAVEDIASRGGECKVSDLATEYVCEIVGTCGFGVQIETINNEHSLFKKIAKLISTPPLSSQVRLILWNLCPLLRRYLYVGDPLIRENIEKLVREVMKQRDYKPSTRYDYIDFMIKLKSEGFIRGESIEKKDSDGTPAKVEMEIDMDLIVAQVFLFFAAGSDTSATAIAHTFHNLAYNPDAQRRVQANVDEAMAKHNGELCYEAVMEMSVLLMAFYETMRLFPPASTIVRVCTKKYTFPDLNFSIDPGVPVVIPAHAIHLDPQYFESPKEFIPERFSNENVQKRHKYAYLPYGAGPRFCVGSRMGEMQSLAGLAAILHKFSVEPAANSVREPKIDHTRNVVQGVVGGLPLKLVPREKSKSC